MKPMVGIALAFAIASSSMAQSPLRTTPPPPGPTRSVIVPQAVEKTLANGLRLIVIEKHGLPLASARLIIKTGGEADLADRAGLADMTASLLTRGTSTKSAEEIAREVEALGASIESGAAWDFSYVALTTLAPNLAAGMRTVADVAMNPAFAPAEIERLRTQNLDALAVSLHDPDALAGFVAARVLYGNEPYGHSLGGTPASLKRITRENVQTFHERWYQPSNVILVVAGDVQAGEVFATCESLMGEWKGHAIEEPELKPASMPSPERKPRVVVIDMPEAGQAAVTLTRRGISRTDADYITAQVANMVLGGDYSSRLNQEVRIKRGLSYGASSSFEARRMAGPFMASAQTKNESAGEVARILAEEISKVGATPVGDAELMPRKANLVGRFGRGIETTAGLVSRIAALALYGLPLSDVNRFVPDVEGVTASEVQKFAELRLGGMGADIVIVGDIKKFGAGFKKEFPGSEIIPVDRLDLDSASLRK